MSTEERLDRLERWVRNEIEIRKKDRERIQTLETIVDEMIVKPHARKAAITDIARTVRKVTLTDEPVTIEELAETAMVVRIHPDEMMRCSKDRVPHVLAVMKDRGVPEATVEGWRRKR